MNTLARTVLILSLSTTPCWAAVEFDGAADGSGTADELDCGAAATLEPGSGDFTLAGWMYVETGASTANTMAGKGTTGSGGQRYRLQERGTNKGNPRFEIDDDGGAQSTVSSTSEFLDEWVCLVGVRDGNNQRLYVNGSEDAASPTDITGYGDVDEDTTPFRMGTIGTAAGNDTQNLLGKVAEVAFWTVALSANEVSQYCNSRTRYVALQIQPASLGAYWTLDDEEEGTSSDGDTFTDKSGNGNTCTGDDGTNNTGLTARGDELLSYPL